MLRKELLLGAIILSFSMILPSAGICIPFSVSGGIYITDEFYESEFFEIEGTMDIDEPEVIEDLNIYFSYHITDFSLSIGDQVYTGTSSEIHSNYYAYGDSSFTCEFDVFQLTSDDGALNWQFLSAGAVFYDKDGVAYQDNGEPTDFYYLPYLIEAEGLGAPDSELCGNHVYVDSLTIERTAPVPEPGTIILLSIGLFGASAIKRRKRSLPL